MRDLCRSHSVVKRHVGRLGLDTSHFTGQRRWSDAQLRRAVASAYCWSELLSELGLAHDSTDDRTRIKAHAARLGLDLSRLQAPGTAEVISSDLTPNIKRLREAGATVAAMWFLLCGCNASIPVEPTTYDLLVSMPDEIKRIQVKTTTYNGKDGWVVQVGRRPYSVGNRGLLVPYDPDALDFFFILDGDLTMYLIPSRVIAGRVMILLRNYSSYIVGNISSL
jgi:PD-(D/E)XK endonuclease